MYCMQKSSPQIGNDKNDHRPSAPTDQWLDRVSDRETTQLPWLENTSLHPWRHWMYSWPCRQTKHSSTVLSTRSRQLLDMRRTFPTDFDRRSPQNVSIHVAQSLTFSWRRFPRWGSDKIRQVQLICIKNRSRKSLFLDVYAFDKKKSIDMDRTQVIRVNNDLLLDKFLQENIVPLQLSCRLIVKRDRLSSSDAIRGGSERTLGRKWGNWCSKIHNDLETSTSKTIWSIFWSVKTSDGYHLMILLRVVSSWVSFRLWSIVRFPFYQEYIMYDKIMIEKLKQVGKVNI